MKWGVANVGRVAEASSRAAGASLAYPSLLALQWEGKTAGRGRGARMVVSDCLARL